MLKTISSISIMIFLFGCGADSDLLRDDLNSRGKPSGNAYKILDDKVYSYKRIDNKQIGFEYLALNEECSTELCYLLKENYVLFNGESKKLPIENKIILSSNGWYEKSQDSECSITFSGNKITQRCPDGTEQITTITEKKLEGLPILNELNNTSITIDEFKDPDATFTHGSMHYDFKQINSHRFFEVLNSDDSKCYSSIDMDEEIDSDKNLTLNSTIVCSIDNIKIELNHADKYNGTFKINSELSNSKWYKYVEFQKYPIIELNVTINNKDKNYFIASYNGTVRIGKILEKEKQKSYINTEAFNSIYTQLNDEYKAESQTYQKLKENYFRVGLFGGKQAYKQFFVDEDDRLNISYKDFSDEEITANWILTSKGLKRESLICDSKFYFHGFDYKCEDGREGSVSYIKEVSLQNRLIDNYLNEQGLYFDLENKNKFFSIGAKELIFNQKNLSGISYIFNVDGSYNIGENPLENNASILTARNLFISTKDKTAYAKLIDLDKGDSGVVEIYELNNTFNDIQHILASAKKIENTTIWERKILGDNEFIEIVNSDDFSKKFHNTNNIAIIEFLLNSQKLISGTFYEDSNKTVYRYLNIDAYEDILDNTE